MDRRSFLLRTSTLLTAFSGGPLVWAAEKPKANSTKSPGKPKPPVAPFVPGSWTIAIMPDIQKYTSHYPGLARLQARWIAENTKKRDIVYVLQSGDLTDNNRPRQWERASRAMGILDGVVPYSIVTGNHDYSDGTPKDRSTRINDYFPPSRFQHWPTFGGTMDPGRIENNYHLFEAGGREWIVVGLEFGPRDHVLEWADSLLSEHSHRTAIVFTHAYVYSDSTRYDWATKGTAQANNPHRFNVAGGVNDGEEMWNKLIRKHANVFMVMNGHIPNDGLGFQVSKGDHGNLVNEMAVNYQRLPIGGGAWTRLLEFLPDGKTVQARTYSPFYEEYETSEDNQFVMALADPPRDDELTEQGARRIFGRRPRRSHLLTR